MNNKDLDAIPLSIILKNIMNAEGNTDGSPFKWKVDRIPFLKICDEWENLLSHDKGIGAISLVKYWLKNTVDICNKSDEELQLTSINILKEVYRKYVNINPDQLQNETLPIIVLKNVAECFLNEYNLEFIEKHNSVSGFSSKKDKVQYLSGLYKKEFVEYFDKYLSVEKEEYFEQWSDSKEIIEVILEEGKSNEVPPMTSLLNFLSKYFRDLTNEEISSIIHNCKCRKITSPNYREYHEYIDTYKRKMTLTDLSKALENIYSKKGAMDVLEYINLEELVLKFSKLVPTMNNIEQYENFKLKEKLDAELNSKKIKVNKAKI